MLARDRLFRCSWLLGATAFFLAARVSSADEDVELRVKAAYLLNFARFVEWPPSSADASDPVVIAVLGHDSITTVLEDTVRGKTIHGHPIRIRQFASPEEVDRCNILFVPRSESKKVRPVLTDLALKPVLTVGEEIGFLDLGGVIEFHSIDDTLRFAISLTAADRAGLKIRSELLGVAYSITGKHK